MKNSSFNYQINNYSHRIDSSYNWKNSVSFSLIQSRECNLDTFLKTIYMNNVDKFFKIYKYHEFSDKFKSVYFELDFERYRFLVLDITPSDVARVLKQIRIHRGYSLEKLALLTGFSKTSISHRESLKSLTFPNLKTLQKYLDSCKLTFFQFIYLVFFTVMIG